MAALGRNCRLEWVAGPVILVGVRAVGPVPGLLEVGTERVPNPMPGQPPLDPKVSDLAVPFYTGPASVRRSRAMTLSDPGMSFQHTGRSSLVGRFDYNGP